MKIVVIMLWMTILFFVQLIQGGKGEAIRIRAILRSLIPIQDLQGVISISFQIPSVSKGWIGHIGQTLAAVAFFLTH